MTRRELLARAASAGVLLTVPVLACRPTGSDGDGLPVYHYAGPLGPEATFEHGVASGDPLQDAVLLWTRVSPGALGTDGVEVFMEVARDPAFTDRIAAAWFVTDAGRDHTLTVDATELAAGTTHYYRFCALGRVSAIGRTKTAGGPGTTHVRLAACACANYGYGYLHAYRFIAQRPDLDAVLHLGDYIYEYASAGEGRTYGTIRELDPPHEITTLSDYRRRYAHYRRDPDLQALHRQHPMIHVWDDHEFANDPNIGGAENHQADEGDWQARRDSALQAYTEWMPTRLRDGATIYRVLDFGLVQLVMLDRMRRFLWPAPEDDHYLGREQADWLLDQLAGVTAPWLLLGQGSTFAPRAADGVGGSSWDRASRRAVLDAVSRSAADSLVVLTGDIHRFDALDIVGDPSAYDAATGAGSVGVEWIAGSISSPGETSDHASVPQHLWSNGQDRGYCIIDVTPERAQADFYGFFDLLKLLPDPPDEQHLQSFLSRAGENHLEAASAPVETRTDAPALAP
jgi:alkaline phosphatase D